MPTPVEIRPVHADEHADVAELTARVYLDEGWSDEEYATVLRDVQGRAAAAHVLVALVAGEVVGAVTVATRRGPLAELGGPGDAVVRMLAVSPSARGAGVGEGLVRACLDLARRDGCTRVLLSTQPEMRAAHRVYARLGFVRAAEHDWRPVPDLLLLGYALELGPGPVPELRDSS